MFHALNQMKFGAEDMFGTLRAKLGAMVPKVETPTIKLPRYQTGGSVGNITDFGSLNLFVEQREVGTVYAEPDVLRRLEQEVKRKSRRRSN